MRGTAKLARRCVLEAQRNTLGKFEDPCKTMTLVAAATEDVAREIVDALK